MPKITNNEKGGKIVWDTEDFVSGLAPNWTTSVVPVIRGGNLLSYSSSMNPFRKMGYPLPGYRPTQVTTNSVVDSYLRKGLVSGTVANIISSGAKIHQLIIADPGSFRNDGTFPHTITPTGGNTPLGNDAVLYYGYVGGTLAQRFFYSYTSSTIWDIGYYDLSSSFDDDFMSTAPATPLASPYTTGGKDAPHPMIIGDDNVMYIGDRNFLHAYDATSTAVDNDGQFFPAVLTLKSQWIITSIEKTEDGLMIFAYSSNIQGGGSSTGDFRGSARAFLWKYGELDITRSYDLNDNFTGESFTIGTQVGVFTFGRIADSTLATKRAKIQLFDDEKFKPEISFVGSLPCRGGVEVQGNNMTFNSGGIIYSFGSKILGDKAGLHKIAVCTGTSSGMLSTFYDANQILTVSSGTTTTGGAETFSANYREDSACLTSLAEPFFPTYSKGRVKNVKIEFSNTVTPANSTELNLKLYDRNGTSLATILATYTGAATTDPRIIQVENDTSGNPLPAFDGLALYQQWTKASGIASESFGIARVELEYEIININIQS
jgi:hypothetical protein